jgi:hypothetical protein
MQRGSSQILPFGVDFVAKLDSLLQSVVQGRLAGLFPELLVVVAQQHVFHGLLSVYEVVD